MNHFLLSSAWVDAMSVAGHPFPSQKETLKWTAGACEGAGWTGGCPYWRAAYAASCATLSPFPFLFEFNNTTSVVTVTVSLTTEGCVHHILRLLCQVYDLVTLLL